MKVIFIFIILLMNNICFGQNSNDINFKDFALRFEPTNVVGQDTFAVSRLPLLTDSMNEFIINNRHEAKDYILLVFLKMYKNHLIINNMSYDYCYSFGSSLTHVIISYFEFDVEMPCHEINDYFIFRETWKKRRKIKLSETKQVLKDVKDIRGR